VDIRTKSDKKMNDLLQEIKRRKSKKYGGNTGSLEDSVIENVSKGLTTTQKDIRRTKLNRSMRNRAAKKKLKKLLKNLPKLKGEKREKELERISHYRHEIKNRDWNNSQTDNDKADKVNLSWLKFREKDSDEYIANANRNKRRLSKNSKKGK